jgi:uncharacterized membrane-anchored protein
MRARNLPTIDAGYWAAIVAASMCGTNAGDLAAGPLGLGHVRGMLPIALLFLAVVWAEKALDRTTVAFYWLAIILLRTVATNIADFATHEGGLSYPVSVALLIVFMAAILWFDRARSGNAEPLPHGAPRLPLTDWSYWGLMLAAGVLGTALGDWIADAGLGVYWASLICAPIFAAAVWAAYRFGLTKPWYWLAIATCRTWGTDLGDMLVALFRSVASRPAALWISTALTAVLLATVIALWTNRSRAPGALPQEG